jgi:hypothetical protein
MLALGCKGVTCINLGNRPNYNYCFKTKELAIEKQNALNKDNPNCCAKVFSIHFYNDGKNGDDPEVTFSRKGKANMRKWDESPQPGNPRAVYFDFGFLNPDGTITHADQYYNPDRDGDGKGDYFRDLKIRSKAKIYISNQEEWEESYAEFNEEVWCAQCISDKAGPTK